MPERSRSGFDIRRWRTNSKVNSFQIIDATARSLSASAHSREKAIALSRVSDQGRGTWDIANCFDSEK